MSAWEQSSGATDEWYTPAYIFSALAERFDLDVAAPEQGPLHVPTERWFHTNALAQPWFGFVWMNPPFGGRNGLVPWLDRFFEHANGIALTPDRTSAPWFRNAAPRASAILFVPKVKFIRPDGTIGKQPGTGTALWASGPRATAALMRACKPLDGVLMVPISRRTID